MGFLYLTGRVTFSQLEGICLPEGLRVIFTTMEGFLYLYSNGTVPQVCGKHFGTWDPRMLTRFNIVPSLLIWVLPKPIYDTSISLYANNGWMFVSLNAFRGNTVSFGLIPNTVCKCSSAMDLNKMAEKAKASREPLTQEVFNPSVPFKTLASWIARLGRR